jgi:hypothetical protein
VRLLEIALTASDLTAVTLITNLGLDLAQDDARLDEAARWIDRALLRSRRSGMGGSREIDTELALARVRLAQGQVDEGVRLMREAIDELERATPGAVERHQTQVSQAARLVISRLKRAYEARNAEQPGSISAERLKQSEAWLAQMLAMGDG